jgi:hypothetical protein
LHPTGSIDTIDVKEELLLSKILLTYHHGKIHAHLGSIDVIPTLNKI